MGVPTRLEEWTLDAVRELLAKGVFESDWFDFKMALPHRDAKDDKERLRKTIAAFANTDGGYLVYGVKDDRGLPVDERIVGIDQAFDFPRHFGEYGSGPKIAPSVDWEPRSEPIKIPETGKLIHVIWIKRSWRKPHAILEGMKFIFPKRTNKGTEDMSYIEVRQAFQETEFRRTKLSLLLSELDYLKKVAERLLHYVDGSQAGPGEPLHWAWVTRYGTTLIDVTLGDVFSFLAADPQLWGNLAKVRDAASRSNVVCEAFSNIVYTPMTSKEYITTRHYQTVKECAEAIVANADKARQGLERLLT